MKGGKRQPRNRQQKEVRAHGLTLQCTTKKAPHRDGQGREKRLPLFICTLSSGTDKPGATYFCGLFSSFRKSIERCGEAIEDAGDISTGGQNTWDQSGRRNNRDKFTLYGGGKGG